MKKRLAILAMAFALGTFSFSAFAEEVGTTDAAATENTTTEEAGTTDAAATENTTTEESTTSTDSADHETTGKEEESATHVHTWNNGEVVKEPTCTATGVMRYTCQDDPTHIHEEIIPAAGHTWSSDVEGVNWGRVTVEPTCTTPGQAEDYCVICGEINTDIQPRIIQPIAHDYSVKKIIKEANCAHEGSYKMVCSVCGKPETEINKDGKEVEKIYTIDIIPNYHDTYKTWDAWITEKAPTCKDKGLRYRHCPICGAKQVEDIPVLKPKYEVISSRLVDCYTQEVVSRCSLCEGKVHEDKTETFDVVAHVFKLEEDYLDDNASKDPTCVEDGKNVYNCVFYHENEKHESDPEATKTIVVPALGHDWTDWVERHPVGEEGNEYGYWLRTCKRCGESQELISKEDPNKKEEEAPKEEKNGFYKDEDGKIRLYKDDQVRTDMTDVVSYNDGLFFITEGVLDTDANGLNLYGGTWYFLAGGQVQSQFSGFAEYDNNWFMIKNGMLDENANGLYEYNGGTFLFAAGKLRTDVSGLWQNSDGKWYYLANGQVQTQHTGVVQYDGAFFYVRNGELATDYNGTVDYDGKTFKVVAGQLY